MEKILIVDDAAFMRMNLKNFIEEAGFEVIGEAENGRDAIEKYKTLRPDVVILDITMPVMDGLEALKTLMNIDSKAKVIICSAIGQKAKAYDAIEMGAKDFVAKPFSRESIIKSIQKCVS